MATRGCRVGHEQFSNSLQDIDLACAAFEFREQTSHGLVEFIVELFDQPGLCPLTVAMIDRESLLAQINRRPNVLTGEALGDFPLFFENVDLTAGIHFADEVQPSGSEGQFFRNSRNLPTQQFCATLPPGGLTDTHSAEIGWGISLIPGQKLRAFAKQITERSKVILIPKALNPDSIDAFHDMVSLRFPRRDEDRFDAQVQKQSNDFAEDGSGASEPCESRVIIEL